MCRSTISVVLVVLCMVGLSAMPTVVDAAASASAPVPATAPTASASDIDAYLAGKGSPMAGQGSAFVASGGRWQVDPRLLVAIAGAESSFGAITCAPFNAWGWGCPNGPYVFESWADGIDAVARGLRIGYLAEGRASVAQINLKYAPIGAANDPTGLNNHWTTNVSRFLLELGGDPMNVDTAAVAGTRPLGSVADPSAAAGYSFAEEQPGDASKSSMPRVDAGRPRAMTVTVRNTGAEAWSASGVRLRRVDVDPRVGGDPFGSITSADVVEPGEAARFVVRLTARGGASGVVTTRWRLEGASGLFGPEIVRDVELEIPALVAGQVDVSIEKGGDELSTVVVRVRNAGSATWRRDGEGRVMLGLRASVGARLQPIDWPSDEVASALLERSVAPGETGSFAFRVHGQGGALVLAPFDASTWAAGIKASVVVGALAPATQTALDAELARRD